MYDWYPSEWWILKELKPGDCSNEELTEFLDKVLTIQLPEFGNGSTEIGTVSQWCAGLCVKIHPKFIDAP